jgi:hypothetical protein
MADHLFPKRGLATNNPFGFEEVHPDKLSDLTE